MARTRHRRRELFPPDRGLQARMLVATVLTPLVVVGGCVLFLLTLHGFKFYALVVFIVLALVACLAELRPDDEDELLAADAEPELWAIVDRLCVAADLPRPELVVDRDRAPNSWVVDLPRRPARLYVTRGLLKLLEPAELEAVIAHELAHVANRDAAVMTVVGMPADKLAEAGGASSAAWLIGGVARIGSSSLSRHRELTADAGAAALTGRPSALASALLKVSGALASGEDLRGLGRPTLNLVPITTSRWDRLLLWRTHPPVRKRVAALERMERRLAAARPAAPRD